MSNLFGLNRALMSSSAKHELALFLARLYKEFYSGRLSNRCYRPTNLFNRPGVLSDM